jgi:hypothetical protein
VAKKPKSPTRRLKVFRTPIGFHDAYVAVPSKKAALEAWGADSNLFAEGIAEQVDDPALMEEALERPGEVIRRLRGSEAEHVAALGAATLPRKGKEKEKGKAKPKGPKPSRAELDAAEEALEKAEKRMRAEIRDIDQQIERLTRERRTLQRRHEEKRDELAEERDRARTTYERAVRAWKD